MIGELPNMDSNEIEHISSPSQELFTVFFSFSMECILVHIVLLHLARGVQESTDLIGRRFFFGISIKVCFSDLRVRSVISNDGAEVANV